MAFMLALSSAALAAGPQYALQVHGLACPFCAYGVEKALAGIDGVAKVEVEIRNGRVVVTLREGSTLTEATARQAVDEAGFTLGGFDRLDERTE